MVFCTLRLLLPLVACVLVPIIASPNWSEPDELVHLYTSNSRNSYFLEIRPNGQVDRTGSETIDSALMIKPVSAENVRIIGGMTQLNLCMRSDGSLYGSVSFSNDDCVFKHTLFETNYDIYESVGHKFLVSLGRDKAPLVPNRRLPSFSQFLKRRNQIPLSDFHRPSPQPEDPVEDSDDPCGGILYGKIPEEMTEEIGQHPCLLEGDERDPLGGVLSGRFPSPRMDHPI